MQEREISAQMAPVTLISRRNFGKLGLSALAACSCGKFFLSAARGEERPANRALERFVANVESASDRPLPAGTRTPGAWDWFAITRKSPARLRFEIPPAKKGEHVYLSVTNAIELWKSVRIEASLEKSARVIGVLDIHNSFAFQPHRMRLDWRDIPQMEKQALVLKISESSRGGAFYAFSPKASTGDNASLLPHIFVSEGNYSPRERFYKSFCSRNSLNPFGWMEGCVTEGLDDLALAGSPEASVALEKHLNFFIGTDGSLKFESSRSTPLDGGAFHSIEDFLPFAAIARRRPGALCLKQAREWMLKNSSARGRIYASTEGCYTYAYPMMEMAKALDDPRLAPLAADEVFWRADALFDSSGIYQRSASGKRAMRNWGRGVAWFLLGLARTIACAENVQNELEPSAKGRLMDLFERACAFAAPFQSVEGYWNCFMHEPETASETSATAGIAAAFALGARRGWLSPEYEKRAVKAREWLFSECNITPDGHLCNVTQSNRLGEDFQKGGYRVIMQAAEGLLAQLDAQSAKKHT